MKNQKLMQSQFDELEINKSVMDTNTTKEKLTDSKQGKFIYASYGRRILSNIIDGLIILLIFISIDFNQSILVTTKPYGDYVVLFSIIVLYHSFLTSYVYEATIGKKLCKIKIVNDNGNALSIKLSIMRSVLAVIFYISFILVLSFPLIYLIQYLEKIGISFVIFDAQVFGLPILLAADLGLMYFFFGILNKNRTFYDKLSKSHVLLISNSQCN